ncbi:hypothetical protein GOP47_0024822 [Adiantum capillus-veneris]|uniref:Uncharacterized protein n=1 Tax=Adiantum capillus-veneris TaxID=13818 RepID=A0A9D4U3D7_ADICA|nr:hypothetical protein GOP47_0024822 [Adiantum capillus-veneris]
MKSAFSRSPNGSSSSKEFVFTIKDIPSFRGSVQKGDDLGGVPFQVEPWKEVGPLGLLVDEPIVMCLMPPLPACSFLGAKWSTKSCAAWLERDIMNHFKFLLAFNLWKCVKLNIFAICSRLLRRQRIYVVFSLGSLKAASRLNVEIGGGSAERGKGAWNAATNSLFHPY